MEYGYVRVSTSDQNIQRQLTALYADGLDDKHILIDKVSGKDSNRKSYNLLVGTDMTAPLLRAGDCLVITSLDRLGRNYTEIKEEWHKIVYTIGADIRVIEIPLLNTEAQVGTLERKFITDLILQMLSYVAEKERNNIKERQRQGIAAARAAGKKLGRPAAQYPSNWKEVYAKWQSGAITAKTAMKEADLKGFTFYKLSKKYEEENGIERNMIHGKKIKTD